MLLFGTKAETLERLAPWVNTATVLPQARLTVGEWHHDRHAVLLQLQQQGWLDRPVIVRSSALQEDGDDTSLAGQYTSVPAARGGVEVCAAIERVVTSYDSARADDQVFLQPQLSPITVSGVAFGVDPASGGPYIVVNDLRSPHTGAVTNGTAADDELFYWLRSTPLPQEPHLVKVIHLMNELEHLLGTAALDVEFAWDDETLYLLQVRRLLRLPKWGKSATEAISDLNVIASSLRRRQTQFPQVLGEGIAWGAMPDWNPAEMIGLRPRPLAYGLYRECLTDRTWAEQRRRYGYRDLTGVPLMESYGGQAFIDIRASLTSFVPAAVPDDLANRLVDYYLDELRSRPELHDKIEIDLVFHCWTFDVRKRLTSLPVKHALKTDDIESLEQALRDLTVHMLQSGAGPWHDDCHRMMAFEMWLQHFQRESHSPTPARMRLLLQRCRDEAASAFAGLARAGFVAVCLVNSLVHRGVWTELDRERFFRSQQTVLSQMHRDRSAMSTPEFLVRYGHLRPGTYDILVPRYDEAPGQYLLDLPSKIDIETSTFEMSASTTQQLENILSAHPFLPDIDVFLGVLSRAIQMREYGKFVYSQGISELLRMLGAYATGRGLSRDACSFADQLLWDEAAADDEFPDRFHRAIAQGRTAIDTARGIALPPLLLSLDELHSFRLPRCQPNFVTQGVACGRVVALPSLSEPAMGLQALNGAVVLLPSADPGYDWIFSAGIVAFITKFGGANSHMAIRAREWNLPAAIGVGEVRYRRLETAHAVRVDCLHQLLVTLP